MIKGEEHPFAQPGEWLMARLVGRLYAIKVAELRTEENGDVSCQAEHSQRWYTIEAAWAEREKAKLRVGVYLVLFPAGHIGVMDAAFVGPNLVIDDR